MTKDLAWWCLAALVAAIALHSYNVKAETYTYLGAWSDHPFSEHEYNETHNLIAVEHNQWFGGYFRNSYDEDSFAAGYRFEYKFTENLEGSLMAGATYGYRSCVKGWEDQSRRVCPAVVPMISYTRYRVQPTVAILGNAVAVTFRIEL